MKLETKIERLEFELNRERARLAQVRAQVTSLGDLEPEVWPQRLLLLRRMFAAWDLDA